MPNYYCQNPKCKQYNLPQYSKLPQPPPEPKPAKDAPKSGAKDSSKDGPQEPPKKPTKQPPPPNPACKECKQATARQLHESPRVAPPFVLERLQTAGKGGQKGILPTSAPPMFFYCQNPNQSGDTYGVGVALALLPKMNLMFFGSSGAMDQAKGFVVYYYDITQAPDRLCLLVGDEDPRRRDEKKAIEEEGSLEGQMSDFGNRERADLDAKQLRIDSLNKARKRITEGEWPLAPKPKPDSGKKQPRADPAEEAAEAAVLEINKQVPDALPKDTNSEKATRWIDAQIAELRIDMRGAEHALTGYIPTKWEAFDGALKRRGWPDETPLYVPKVLVPSVLNAEKTKPLLLLDRTAAQMGLASDYELIGMELKSMMRASEENLLRLAEIGKRLQGSPTLEELQKIKDLLDSAERRTKKRAERLGEIDSRLQPSTDKDEAWIANMRTHQLAKVKSAMLACGTYGLWYVKLEDETFVLIVSRNTRDIDYQLKPKKVVATECLFAPGDALSLTSTEKVRKGRFEQRVQLLDFRLTRRNAKVARMAQNYEQAMRCGEMEIEPSLKLKNCVGRILPWTLFDEYAANQLYQTATGVAILLRDAVVSPPTTEKAATALEEAQASPFCTVMDVAKHQYFPIGDTSRNILAVLQKGGLKGINTPLYRQLQSGSDMIRSLVREHMKGFLKQFERPADGRRIMLCLIWIRGLSPKEREDVKLAGIKASDVKEEKFGAVNSAKRNPHHVTTVQMCMQFKELFEWFNQPQSGAGLWVSPDPKRYFVPVFIGDSVYYDQYDTSTPKFLGSDFASNLVEFWNIPSLKALIGPPHNRYRQFCMLKELFGDDRFDVMQMGIRSGVMEQGMYQGMPTIYIEEEFCDSGDRMASLTWEGPSRAALDAQFRNACGKASGEMKAKLSRLRFQLDMACIYGDASEEIPRIDPNDYAPHEKEVAVILKTFSAILQRPVFDFATGGSHPGDKALDTFPPECNSARRGFPHFYRLITRHLVGLHQMKDAQNATAYLKWVKAFLVKGKIPAAPDASELSATWDLIYKGGLQPQELIMLWFYLSRICAGYGDLRKQLA